MFQKAPALLLFGGVRKSKYSFFPLLSLQNLVKHLPEQEQLNALAKYKNDYPNLSEPEQFGVIVSVHANKLANIIFFLYLIQSDSIPTSHLQ